MLFKASAPGSLMLLGEYAVLHRKQALVCAIDKRITVSLTPRLDKKIHLESSLGSYQTTLDHLKRVPPFQFVLAALGALKKYLKQGCDIKIESEFSATVGFASSAAVTVATLSALSAWLEMSFSEIELITLARKIVHRVQGIGSGADVAACVMGGIVLYRTKPLLAEKLPHVHPITVVYSGSKTPTVTAVKQVAENFSAYPKLFKQLCRSIHYCTTEGAAAILAEDWRKLGELMNIQQGLMESLGVNTPILSEIINTLRTQKTILGAKISGSGLGDCVVGLGEGVFATQPAGAQQMQVQITNHGVSCEKI